MTLPLARAAGPALPLVRLTPSELGARLGEASERVRRWVEASGFSASPGALCAVPDAEGGVERAFQGAGDEGTVVDGALAAAGLPAGTWQLAGGGVDGHLYALGWGLAAYAFDRYRTEASPSAVGRAVLSVPEGVDLAAVERECAAVGLVRDLISTPASDMGPEELAAAAVELAEGFGAQVRIVAGDSLLDENFPMIHAVGRASDRAPRLVDFTWGDRGAPKVTLVGKGVCFDSGGLDLKPSQGMLVMKKDMGGAAHVLGLAQLVMASELPVRLRVLVPAVENSVSGNAMRPLDVIPTRAGKTVEIGNTDAEGRLVLADALTLAASEEPDVILDFATLTGAARVALGTELPALFSNDDDVAAGMLAGGERTEDPLWRMPLHAPYRRLLKSPVADLNNVSDGPHGGAITAALFLQEFVDPVVPWAHVDVMAWNKSSRPAHPEGGEAMGLRATFAWLRERFGA